MKAQVGVHSKHYITVLLKMNVTNKQSELIYTTSLKAFNLEIESPSIGLSESAWIESSSKFINKPLDASSLYGFSSLEDPQFGLTKFLPMLVSSPVIFRTKHTEKEFERNPFQVHDCSYIAAAISIVCDPWFVVGIDIFSNNRDPDNYSLGPWITFFVGDNSGKPGKIFKKDEQTLIIAYKFVYNNLALSSWDSEIGKLILLFLRCVTRTPYQRFNVLKLGLDHLFTEWHATVLNAALFFEYLLTKESEKRPSGVKHWNNIFTSDYQLDENLIDMIFQYRHIVTHFNPTSALRKIDEWKTRAGLDSGAALAAIRRAIWSSAKTCLRAIVEDEETFHSFCRTKPK
jgi:hypothetical protein